MCFKECWPVTADVEGSEEPDRPAERKGDGEEDEEPEEPEEPEVESSYLEDPDEKLNLSEVIDLTANTIPNGKCWKSCLHNYVCQVCYC